MLSDKEGTESSSDVDTSFFTEDIVCPGRTPFSLQQQNNKRQISWEKYILKI